MDSSGSFSIKKPGLGLTYLVFFFQALGAKDKLLWPVEDRDAWLQKPGMEAYWSGI